MKMKSLLPVIGLSLIAAPAAVMAAPAKADGAYPVCTKSRTDECRQAQKTAAKPVAKHSKRTPHAKRDAPREVARR